MELVIGVSFHALGTSIYRVLNMNEIKYILGVTRLIIKVINMMINVQSI